VKKIIPPYLTLIVFCTAASFGCKKGIKDPVVLDKAAGKWSINAIRMQVYNGTTLISDSTVPWRPIRENYANFDGISRVDYCFNSVTTTSGNYRLMENDSMTLHVGDDNRRWRVLLLTPTNFNIETTSTDNNLFPGATVKTFQSFVR
jgi:hypothetical protein